MKSDSNTVMITATRRTGPQDVTFARTSSEDLTIEAAAEGAEGDKKLPTFKINAYTGVPMLVGFGWPVIVDLAGMRRDDGSKPVLRDHDPSQIVGHTTEVKITTKALVVKGVMSGSGDITEPITSSAKNGFPWQASIGAAFNWDRVEEIKAGQKVNVNGRNWTGPLYVARASVLKEISFVAMGADENTSAAVAAQKEQTMNFENWLKAKGFDHATLTDAQRETLQAAYDADVKASQEGAVGGGDPAGGDANPAGGANPAGNGGNASDPVLSVRAEMSRVTKINAICRDHPEIAAKAIEDGWTVEKAELEILRKGPAGPLAAVRAGRATPPRPSAGNANEPQEQDVIVAAALMMMPGTNKKTLEAQFDQRTLDAATRKENRVMTPQAMVGRVLSSAGEAVGFGGDLTKALGTALRISASLQNYSIQASGNTHLSLPGLFTEIGNRTLLNSYLAFQSTIAQWCGSRTLKDFRPHDLYRLSADLKFERVAKGGQLKHGKLKESKYSVSADTFGIMINFDRRDFINDDLGAMMETPRLLGREAALSRETAAFELLLRGEANNFFTAGNGNLNTGGGSALSFAGLTAAAKKYMESKDASGKPIALTPNMLLVPPALSALADQFFVSQNLNETTTANVGKGQVNIHANKYRPVASPFLSPDATVAGLGSDTAWYMGAGSDAPAVIIGYVNGQTEPTIEQGQVDFSQLGFGMRAYLDFGVGYGDPKALQKNTGA